MVGIAVAVAAPFASWGLARGIAPPPSGVGLDLWLGWEIPLGVVASALALLTVALVPRLRFAPGWAATGAVVWSVAAVMLGLALWQPDRGWPSWYGLVWLPA